MPPTLSISPVPVMVKTNVKYVFLRYYTVAINQKPWPQVFESQAWAGFVPSHPTSARDLFALQTEPCKLY